MFRRARLSVKPNVRPGVGARSSAAPNPQRGREAPRPAKPAAEAAPKPAEPTDVPAVDSGGAEPPKKAPGNSAEKTGGEKNVEESSKCPPTVSQRRKRVSSTSSVTKTSVSVPSQSHPLSTVNQGSPQPNLIPAKEKPPCSDKYRIYKAQKLREMLKEELRKEKKQWKNKYAINESQRPPDRSKMTMRDFIYYLPDSNPMTSSLEQEKKPEKSLTPAQIKDSQENKSTTDDNANEEVEEEEDDGPLLVPRVKVAEDGSIILDEESLTVEVLRTKGPCVVEENDPIFERGSTTTYSSFRKNYYSKPWSNKETDMFFLAISMVGTDFSMIGQLFPHRARIEIKNKFKREEKTNGWRIDKAFQEKRPFDFDFFAHLLQKVLAEEEKRKQKSTKSQNVKKKKSSKAQKNIKAEKVTSDVVNDDPDESVSTNISDPERSPKDPQTVEEEESLNSSGQGSEQVVLEQDQSHKTRRKKSQDEAKKQEHENLLEKVPVQSGLVEAETHQSKGEPEINESKCSKEQSRDDIDVDLVSSEKLEMRTDPVPLACSQQDIIRVATESESSTSDLPVSEAGIAALYEVNNPENSCTEESNVDQKTKLPETDQIENVKPTLRSRLLRPKPNLSRAVGKKSVVSQGKTHGESKNSHSETSVEKDLMEKEKTNISDSCAMENTERENPEAETVSNLSEKNSQQEDNHPKVCRPARLMKTRMQRLKPNVEKAVERKEILTPEENIGSSEEMNDKKSCVERDVPQQMEDQSCKNVQCEDIISQTEKKDTSFQNVQPDEPKVISECLSIQEGNQVNKPKQAPIVRTRFQKPKPNIGRGTGRRGISSKEEATEIIASGEMTTLRKVVTLDTSPRENAASAPPITKELESDLKESGKSDTFPSEKMPEMTDVTVEMEIGLEEVGGEIFPRKMAPEVIDISLETEAHLPSSGNVSPMEKIPEMIDSTQKISTNLEETGKRELLPQENCLMDVKSVNEMEIGLQEIGKEVSLRERTPDLIDVTEENESDLKEPERQEISTLLMAPEEVKTIEIETDLKETGGETLLREKAPVEVLAVGEKETYWKETGERDISMMEIVSVKMTAVEETKEVLKKAEREISVSCERRSEEIYISEMTDLEKTVNIGISPREHEPEERDVSEQTETNVMQSSSGDHNTRPSLDSKNITPEVFVLSESVEEKESADKEVLSPLSHVNSSSQNSGFHEKDQGIQPPAVVEQFSNTNLSKSLPQEQKPLEVKPAPFVRSRFKRPKPNLARAILKRETTEAEKHAPEKKSEINVMQRDSEQTIIFPSQPDVAFLMTSRENDKSDHKEEAVILPCIQTEKDVSPSYSCESKEELTQHQENDLVVSVGTQKMNTTPQETKQSTVPSALSALPVRGRLKRPRPNVQRARQRHAVEKGEAEGIIKGEGTTLQKEETEEKSLTVGSNPEEGQGHESSSQIETEIEVVSCKVSEGRVNENQSHVVPAENINKRNILDEEMRPENKPYVPSSAPLIRRHFQKAKPNLGRASLQNVQPGVEKDTADWSSAHKLEYHSVQQRESDNQLPLKEKVGSLTSLEISTKDCIGSNECGLAKKDAHLEVGSSGNVGEETVGDNSVSLVVEEQHLSTQTSHPQQLKESNHSKIVSHRRTALPPSSECEMDHSGKRMYRKIKPNVTKGRGAKRIRGKTAKKEPRASKSMLVTLRASQKEEDDAAEDFDSDYEDETYHLAPEELNKAPVFVPVGLRSPEPVSAQIEETMEELEIPVNVVDEGCVTVAEQQLPNTDAVIHDVKQESSLHTLSFEMMAGEQTQDEPGPCDGSTEAAITLLTMGEIVLQSEISTEQCDVEVCVFPDVHSEEQSHIPFSPDNVSHKIAHEYQEISSPVISVSPESFEENKTEFKEQSTGEEAGVMEEAKENVTPTRDTATVTSNLRMESNLLNLTPNSERILGPSGFNANQEVPNICVAKGTEVEIQRETEKNDSQAVELEDKILGPVTTTENKEQNQLACVPDIKETSISQEANLTKRNEAKEEKSQEVEILSVTPLDSSETRLPMLDSGSGLGENLGEETLKKNSEDDSMLMLHVPEGTVTSIPEVQQENVTNPQDQTVNLFADMHQDGEDEQTFILTLVEIPTSAAEGFTDATVQLMPSSLLPAPILVKSGKKGERGDMSGNLPAASLVQDAMCVSNSNSGRNDSEKSPTNLDLVSRKRFHRRLDESDHVPPAKKSSLTSRVGCQEFASEVCSKELNIFEETGESHKEQGIFLISGSTTPEPEKEQIKPTLQNIGSGSLNEINDPCVEKNSTELPQEEMVVSDKEERTYPASNSGQVDSRASSQKPALSRPGRRPLGFLSLICPKNSLDSDEATQVRSKKRLKPLIPVSRRNLRKSNPHNESQKKNEESSDTLPSTGVAANTQSENTGSVSTQVSSDPPLLNEKHKNGQKQAPQEEPTSISESFFGDIFIEVEEKE